MKLSPERMAELARIRDEDIDTSDVPEASDGELARLKPLYPHPADRRWTRLPGGADEAVRRDGSNARDANAEQDPGRGPAPAHPNGDSEVNDTP